jgi:hypothetical protein
LVTSRGEDDHVPRTAILARRHWANVNDVSRTGCRLTGPEWLKVGDVGMLTVDIAGEIHLEMFRVSRCAALPGEERLYESGVEFLPMPAGRQSLHDLVARLDDAHSA